MTVDEIVLLPGDDAITAPAWVPWRDRIQPGDLAPATCCPTDEDDPRLVPGYLAGDPATTRDQDELPGRRRARPRPRPGALARGPRPGRRSAGTTASQGPDVPLAQSAPGTLRDAAASWCGWPGRCPRCSGCAPTSSPTTTAGWSPSTTAAAPTRRRSCARSSCRRRCPTRCFDTLSGTSSRSSRGPVAPPGSAATSRRLRGARCAAPAVVPADQRRGRSRRRRSTATTGGRRPRAGRRTAAAARSRPPRAPCRPHRADAVDVERVDVGDDVGAVADLVRPSAARSLGVHAPNLARSNLTTPGRRTGGAAGYTALA